MRSIRDMFGGRDYDVRLDSEFEMRLLKEVANKLAAPLATQIINQMGQLLTTRLAPLTQKIDGLASAVSNARADILAIKADVASIKLSVGSQADFDELLPKLNDLHDRLKESNDKLEAAAKAATPK